MIQKIIDETKCRLCLTDIQTECSSIFSLNNKNKESDGLTLSTKIMVCLSLPVQHSDVFPKKICTPCKTEVNRFYSFRERCHAVYHTLLLRQNDLVITNDSNENVNSNINTEESYNTQSNKEVQDDEQLKQIESQSLINSREESTNDVNDKELPTTFDTNVDDDKLITNTECPTVNNDLTDLPDGTVEEIITNPDDNQIQVLEYVEESMSYKCFHCDKLFSDLSTATNHCMKCTNLNNELETNIRLDDKQSKEIVEAVEYIHENSTNDDEKNDITNKIQEITDETSVPKCRKHCRHTKCRRSVRKREKIMHSCPQCDKSFPSACLLKRHTSVHTGERPYECDTCGRRFSQVGALNFHKKFHVNPPYSCKICNKPFMRPSDMEKHMRTHTGEKPFSCQICQKQFAQTTAVQQHERIHTGAKPYACEICGKAFSQSANKRKHVLIHKAGTKPHVCKTCGRCFSDLTEMELHKAGHGGGRPRECDYCGDRFRKLSEISDHIRRYHTFERPHKCAFCPKAFYALYSLKQHVMIHTGQKPYTCVKCDHKFTQKGNLAKHYARKHSDYYCEEKKDEYDEEEDEEEEEEEEEIKSNIVKLGNIDVENDERLEVDELKE
ncbi:hypothetical protein PV328_006765 [Microctonus aethiopoides]|uniref:Zinc finger protein n=1 Tax=Microctonus aethiopoides TaxID=144406 RepID=A0AA39KTY3_9HYME|nr:hypothetical protein PV328_006765 [Microctonus aethiopoides]